MLKRMTTPGTVLLLLLAGASLFQVLESRRDLPGRILRGGRIVLGPGLTPTGTDSPVLDDNPETAVTLRMPGPPPEGSYLLADLALTHFPARLAEAGGHLRPRRARELRISNGFCAACPDAVFRAMGRLRRARVEILYRRANDPDVEFEIPPAQVVWSSVIDFPDRPGPRSIPLTIPDPSPSPAYPKNVFYIICKIAPLELYPGDQFPDRVAIGEIEYFDLDPDHEATLHDDPANFVWNVQPGLGTRRPFFDL